MEAGVGLAGTMLLPLAGARARIFWRAVRESSGGTIVAIGKQIRYQPIRKEHGSLNGHGLADLRRVGPRSPLQARMGGPKLYGRGLPRHLEKSESGG